MPYAQNPWNIFILSITVVFVMGAATLTDTLWDGSVVQYGTMHQAIGMQQHQGRVRLNDLVKKPHFYAVAALEGLNGEITIDDGQITITGVGDSGQLRPVLNTDGDQQATLLVGASIESWSHQTVSANVSAKDFDQFVADAALAAGLDTDKPFPFKVEGKFVDVHLHVIHGACPVHAKMQNKELPAGVRPFHKELDQVEGKMIGVFAKDAAGKLTHPGTSTHRHLLFSSEQTTQTVTGHIEQAGLAKGCILSLPKQISSQKNDKS